MSEDADDAARRQDRRWFGIGVVAGLCAAAALSARAPTTQHRRLQEDDFAECFEGTGWSSAAKVDRLDALQTINADIPAAIQTGPSKAWLLGRQPFTGDALIPEACDEVDVVVAQSGNDRCLLVSTAASTAVPHHVTRWERSGGGWSTVSRIRESKQRMPGEGTRKRARTLAVRLLSKLDEVSAALEPLLERAARFTHPAYAATASGKGAVLIMCVNWGNLDLLMNFLRSACARGIDVRNLVVFAADKQVDKALRDVGVLVFSHPALGSFAPGAARSYGDHTFVEMMWLKLTCVYLVNNLGYDLLFQDADLYWWKQPWEFFGARPDVDTFWMDDGARTSRFAPHFPNTGYYLIRHNARTAVFCETLVGMYDVVLAWQSHQAVVSQVLGEMHALHALTVKILEKEAFASGKQLHHNKPMFERIARGEYEPYCFHMCWTAGKADKLKFLKQEKLWYLEPACDLGKLDGA
eukprot:CAMPEP_0119296616 /NCGR_PEP_ID=MMETSP1329-20130426/50660_1 /TAXON_ID=114041 /ORGANISM="Genus nov. species nov., Strain RCC1024" /LENGTH=466 /DNA_ID=CAMNT_0007297553 /DNA_START=61 /DNA_END=1457 /DNA_ORIENTATION=-